MTRIRAYPDVYKTYVSFLEKRKLTGIALSRQPKHNPIRNALDLKRKKIRVRVLFVVDKTEGRTLSYSVSWDLCNTQKALFL